ncbi:MAG: hypothetical protein IPF60_20585 [Betaproteobacteria bacterium]|nr:hypothetical protein [Betaproteobacteria bacterium]
MFVPTDLRATLDDRAQIGDLAIEPPADQCSLQGAHGSGILKQLMQFGVKPRERNVGRDVRRRCCRVHRSQDRLAPRQRIEMPETRATAAELPGKMKEREVRIGMVSRPACGVEEASIPL